MAQVIIDAFDRGWYDNTGSHSGSNSNYLVGDYRTSIYRDWFAFTLPNITQPIISANLQVTTHSISSPAGMETYELRDVTSPINILTGGGSGLTNVYNDLGDGNIYATQTISKSGSIISIALNQNAINDITNAVSLGTFALGGQITSLDSLNIDEYIFGGSGSADSRTQLILTYLDVLPIEGDNNNNLLNGTSLNEIIQGLGGNDTLNGLAGNDSLDGGTGSDVLNGGIGNDTYIVDNSNDIVQETSTISSEIDKVESSISYTLGTNLENLTLTGTANLQGIGNSLNNRIIGNSGNNLLNGSSGNDTVSGGSGQDTYVVDSDDIVQETSTINSEIDTVESSISYTLGNNLENLTLTGTANLQGTGNNLNNRIIGNSGHDFLNGGSRNDSLSGSWGNDTLDGGTGNDTLKGDNGNDIYLIDNIADVVQETNTATSQIDTIQASIDYTLGTNLENLILTGNSHTQGNGNSQDNQITGNNGDNILNGGNGYDTLSGGLGNDSFRFNSGVAFNSNLALDRIVDFTSNSDKIGLSKTTFTAITSNLGTGFSNGGEFATVTTYVEAESSAAAIVYNTTNDRVFYNQNGIALGFGTGGAFAELLNNPNLVASDFTIIA